MIISTRSTCRLAQRRAAARLPGAVLNKVPGGVLAKVLALGVAVGGVTGSAAAGSDFLLIDDGLHARPVDVAEINDASLVHTDGENSLQEVPLDQCLALLSPRRVITDPAGPGLMRLADGQVIPGTVLSNGAPDEDSVAWHHPWLNRIEVPLERIASISLRGAAPPPEGESDIVALANGDLLEGFLVSMGDPLVLEKQTSDGPELVQVSLDRVEALTLVSTAARARSTRVWFTDGSILDVASIRMRDDGFAQVRTPWHTGADTSTEKLIAHVAAVLFQPGRVVPLSKLRVDEVAAPPSRYIATKPAFQSGPVPLDVSSMTLRGPVRIELALPAGAQRFAGLAVLPRHARVWGDFELVIRDNGREVLKQHFNADSPELEFNVAVTGSRLTFELTEGQRGSIQDELRIERGMILVR